MTWIATGTQTSDSINSKKLHADIRAIFAAMSTAWK
jgi:hypothetical protein